MPSWRPHNIFPRIIDPSHIVAEMPILRGVGLCFQILSCPNIVLESATSIIALQDSFAFKTGVANANHSSAVDSTKQFRGYSVPKKSLGLSVWGTEDAMDANSGEDRRTSAISSFSEAGDGSFGKNSSITACVLAWRIQAKSQALRSPASIAIGYRPETGDRLMACCTGMSTMRSLESRCNYPRECHSASWDLTVWII